MSDEKSPLNDTEAPDPEQPVEVAKTPGKPPVFMIFLIMALLGALIATNIRKQQIAKSSGSSAKLHAEGVQDASPQGAESMEEIASRLKSDTDTLVATAGRFHEILAEKDRALAAKSAELAAAEKSKQTWVTQYERLQEELSRSASAGSELQQLRNQVADLMNERDSLTAELKAALEKMKTMSVGVSAEDFADLQRRLAETERAKEFFESRVKELEGPPK